MSSPFTPVSASDQQPHAPAVMSPMRPFYWSVRRELWEHRSIYIAPLLVAAFTLIGFLIGSAHLIAKVRSAESLGPMQVQQAIERPYGFAALFLMGIGFIVSIFYCVEALHGERRDRSILFWKSLPISDFTVVLSKMMVPLVIVPLITVALTIATHVVMLLLNIVVLQVNGMSLNLLWANLPLSRMWMMMLYHMLALHGLWFAPVYSWMLLASAWARRVPILWAVLPPIAIGVVEKIAFNTTHFPHWMEYRFGGAPGSNAYPGSEHAMHAWADLNIGQFLLNPGLWSGLIAAALFLFAAARVRRNRGPI
jgi:ABC-2 type transport system permease protein